MTSKEVYQWSEIIGKYLPGLKKWHRIALALFSLGVVLAERCTLSKVAERLGWMGKADSLERRLQRFLANEAIGIAEVQAGWARWVLEAYGQKRCLWLVDETKLGQHLGIMVVSLAYRAHAIPLVWRCYHTRSYPVEGQVVLICQLLARVVPFVQERGDVLVVADRGIGTAHNLVDGIRALGLGFLLRVEARTHYRSSTGTSLPLQTLARPGTEWHGRGLVFKNAGWRQVQLHILWGTGYAQPWCLICTHPDLTGWEYSMRFWQEASFRDWKSDGWQWQRSHVWIPVHAERLLLVLALAMAWTLTQGVLAAEQPLLKRALTRGTRPTFSLFRLGLRAFAYARSHSPVALLWDLAFPPPFSVSVVS